MQPHPLLPQARRRGIRNEGGLHLGEHWTEVPQRPRRAACSLRTPCRRTHKPTRKGKDRRSGPGGPAARSAKTSACRLLQPSRGEMAYTPRDESTPTAGARAPYPTCCGLRSVATSMSCLQADRLACRDCTGGSGLCPSIPSCIGPSIDGHVPRRGARNPAGAPGHSPSGNAHPRSPDRNPPDRLSGADADRQSNLRPRAATVGDRWRPTASHCGRRIVDGVGRGRSPQRAR